MKRIISLTLTVLMLVTLLLTATSCEFGMEGITGYTQLRDHVASNKVALTDYASMYLVQDTEDGAGEIHATIAGRTTSANIYVTLILDGSVEKAKFLCELRDMATDTEILATATGEILLTHYTGNELVEFTTIENMAFSEISNREFVSALLNALLLAIDNYTTENLDMSVRDLGFIVLSDKYMTPGTEVEVEEDLGGMFSSARLILAGQMLLMGLGMVFLVLAVLWLVLLIFKKVFYKDPAATAAKAAKQAAKAEKETAKAAPAPVAAPAVAPAPVQDDGQLIAVITAAVAATIEADPALSSQFASGFRVVSFKKTEKTRNR